jgi:hypothetical protein
MLGQVNINPHIGRIAGLGQAEAAQIQWHSQRKCSLSFLKECEFRFNYGNPKQQLTILKTEFVFEVIYYSP